MIKTSNNERLKREKERGSEKNIYIYIYVNISMNKTYEQNTQYDKDKNNLCHISLFMFTINISFGI